MNTNKLVANAIVEKKHTIQQIMLGKSHTSTSKQWVVNHLLTVLEHAHIIFTTPEELLFDEIQQSIKQP